MGLGAAGAGSAAVGVSTLGRMLLNAANVANVADTAEIASNVGYIANMIGSANVLDIVGKAEICSIGWLQEINSIAALKGTAALS